MACGSDAVRSDPPPRERVLARQARTLSPQQGRDGGDPLAALRTVAIPTHEAGRSGYGSAIEEHGFAGEKEVDGCVGQGGPGDQQKVRPVDGVGRGVAAFDQNTPLGLADVVRVQVHQADIGFGAHGLGQCGLEADDGHTALAVIVVDEAEYALGALGRAGIAAMDGVARIAQRAADGVQGGDEYGAVVVVVTGERGDLPQRARVVAVMVGKGLPARAVEVGLHELFLALLNGKIVSIGCADCFLDA